MSTFDLDTAARLKTALCFVEARPDLFRPDFKDWLDRNFHIWLAFEREADQLWRRGHRRYSARTIIEWMRHETAVREHSEGWKLNNNFAPDLARLHDCFYPGRAGFFERRHDPESEVRAA